MTWRWTALAFAMLSWRGLLAADEEQVKWMKLEEARAKSAATGKPVLVICLTDLVSEGPGTKGIDRSFTTDMIRPFRDEFCFVKCTDMATVRAVKVTSKCEFVTYDPDGEEIHRCVTKSTADIAAAMKKTLASYCSRPITWSTEAPAPVERSPDGRRLTVVLFRDESEDVASLVSALEDRSVAKLHGRCTFVSIPFRKDSPDVAKWKVLGAPTLLLLDAEKEFSPKSIVERTGEKKNPRELRALLRRGLAAVEKSHR
ncbi:MAG TPA: hypothetical protein VMU54_16005 [Planctomycetota bacterium]|nr:hypothetical protein [Planctomycetota bacterium]